MKKKTDTSTRSTRAIPATPDQVRAVVTGTDQALSIKEVKARCKVKGDSTIYSWVQRGVLPRPIRIGGARRWLESQLGSAPAA
jgi:predicted DNA-binding transcriptional regulator AlpA